MKTSIICFLALLAAGLAAVTGAPLGTGFTYQGRLEISGSPANGSFNLQFSLWDGPGTADKQTGTNQTCVTTVANGLFSVQLDFGAAMFTGDARWLQIAVVTDGTITPLSPRSLLTATPNALYASQAGTAASASSLVSLAKEVLDLSVNGHRTLRLEPADICPNVLGGSEVNEVTAGVHGAAIGGGGGVEPGAPPFGDTISPNLVTDHFGTVAGGSRNQAGNGNGVFDDRMYATVGGGLNNTASGTGATVPGGTQNTAAGNGSFASGTRAKANHNGSFVWADSTAGEAVSSADNQFLIRATGGVAIQSAKGIQLSAADSPFITRGWDPFDPVAGDRAGSGRWGLFMEPTEMVVGIPGDDIPWGCTFAVAKYNKDGTRESLITVRRDGNLTCRSLTILGGADLAEPFALSDPHVVAGSVVVIDAKNPGRLKLSTQACDRKVAGVVSGAKDIQPGISMIQENALEAGRNVALSGRVYVLADAAFGTIEPGDQLTTSDTPGHAMKVSDGTKAQGAILGKAMSGLETGKGLVLVLVTLQ